jgi:hypothetical protein
MKTRFKVGDRVSDDDYGRGTILHFDDKDRMYVVDFDVSHPALSDCNGHAHSGNGLYIDEVHLTLIESAEQRVERMRKQMLNTPLTFIPNEPEPSRAMIAAMAMQGLLAGGGMFEVEIIAKDAVDLADALIAELQRTEK